MATHEIRTCAAFLLHRAAGAIPAAGASPAVHRPEIRPKIEKYIRRG